jgi:hypothetical protein
VSALQVVWRYISKDDRKSVAVLLPFLQPALVIIVSSLHSIVPMVNQSSALGECKVLIHQIWDFKPILKEGKSKSVTLKITLINNKEAGISHRGIECFYQTKYRNLEKRKVQLKPPNSNSEGLNVEGNLPRKQTGFVQIRKI